MNDDWLLKLQLASAPWKPDAPKARKTKKEFDQKAHLEKQDRLRKQREQRLAKARGQRAEYQERNRDPQGLTPKEKYEAAMAAKKKR